MQRERRSTSPHALRRPWLGLAATAVALAAVDLVKHGLAVPYPFPETLLVGTVTVVAGAGFAGGIRAGFASAALVTAYAIRFYAMPGELLSWTPGTWGSLALLGALAFSAAGMSGALAQHEAALRRRAHDAEADRLAAADDARAAVAAKNLELERANHELAEANRGLESFAFVVAHDLKAPLRGMTFLLDDALGAARGEARAAIALASDANGRLGRLVGDLLEVSQAASLRPQDLRAVDVLATLDSEPCAARYSEILGDRAALLERRGPPGLRALATQAHVAQILGNLVNNAIRHNGAASPTVRVTAVVRGGDPERVDVVVEDNGPGFPPGTSFGASDDRGHARPGFGLRIVRRAVERLGGRLWIERSRDLGGAAVRLTLPAAPTVDGRITARTWGVGSRPLA